MDMGVIFNTENGWWLATLMLYLMADWLYRKAGRQAWAHPVLLPVAFLLCVFGFGFADYEPYRAGNTSYAILLSLAVVALAVPLYRSWGMLRANRHAVFAALAGGSVAGMAAALVPAVLLGASPELLASLAPKSVTTPIAVEVAASIGGMPPISAAVVVVTGLVAALVGPGLLRRLGIDDDRAIGLALGTAGHAIGTAEAARLSDTMGAAAAFAMTVNGLVTALVLPLVWAAAF